MSQVQQGLKNADSDLLIYSETAIKLLGMP
jgi:hypothetical protein